MSTFEDRERAEFEAAMMALEGQGFERGDFDTKTNGDYSCLIIQGASLGWLAHAKQSEADRLIAEAARFYYSATGKHCALPTAIIKYIDAEKALAASQENSKGGRE